MINDEHVQPEAVHNTRPPGSQGVNDGAFTAVALSVVFFFLDHPVLG